MRRVENLILTLDETDYTVEENHGDSVLLRDSITGNVEIWEYDVPSDKSLSELGQTLINIDGLNYAFSCTVSVGIPEFTQLATAA